MRDLGSSEATTSWTAEVSIRAELLAGRLGTRGCQVADGLAPRGLVIIVRLLHGSRFQMLGTEKPLLVPELTTGR